MLLFLLPLFALALIMLPFFVMLKRRKEGKPLKTRKAILINAGSFIGVMVMMSVFVPLFAFASAEGAAEAAQTALSAHDEGPFVTSGANQTVGNAHGINKASANRLHVKRCAPLDAQGILQSAGHRRKQAVGSGCRHDDEVNCLRIDIATRQSVAGRIHSQRKRRLPIHGDVTATDAGARANPFVARLNAALGKLFSEITVGHSTIS